MKLIKSFSMAFKDLFEAFKCLKPLIGDAVCSLIMLILSLKAIFWVIIGAIGLCLYVVLFPMIVIRKYLNLGKCRKF